MRISLYPLDLYNSPHCTWLQVQLFGDTPAKHMNHFLNGDFELTIVATPAALCPRCSDCVSEGEGVCVSE